MRTAAALLLACVALAGCGKSGQEKRAEEQDRVARTVGWHAAFDFPPQAIAAINQAGFGLKQPAASPYRESGRVQPSSGAGAPMAVEIVGHTPSAIDTISYGLLLKGGNLDQARDRFAQVIGQFLDHFAIRNPGPLFAAIRGSQSAAARQGAGAGQASASMIVDGAPVRVTSSAGRLDVTFTRPAPKAGLASTQG